MKIEHNELGSKDKIFKFGAKIFYLGAMYEIQITLNNIYLHTFHALWLPRRGE